MEELFCRICFKFFCCFKCRMKHEKLKHNLEPLTSCDICRFGRIYFDANKKDDTDLLVHISEQHLGLRCRKCNVVFNNVMDLMHASECARKRQIEEVDNKSILLTGNNISKILGNESSERQQTEMPKVTTSTPMGGNSNSTARDCTMEIVSPTDSQLLSMNDFNQISKNITPINNINNPSVPLVTPLRSIMTKNKSHRDSTDRHVTFSDIVQNSKSLEDTNSKGSYLGTNNYSKEKLHKYSQEKEISSFTLSPSTPNCSKSEIFYTPDGPSPWKHDSKIGSRIQINPEEHKSLGLKGIFDNISKVISNAFRSVFIKEENEPQQYYMHTSGSIKRFLSPNADRSVPKLKKICVRGRQPINRSTYSLNEKQ